MDSAPVTLPPRPCSGCGEKAVCEYDWGTGLRYGCAAHDPLRPPSGAMARVPPWYRTIAFPVAMTSTVGINPVPAVTYPSFSSVTAPG